MRATGLSLTELIQKKGGDRRGRSYMFRCIQAHSLPGHAPDNGTLSVLGERGGPHIPKRFHFRGAVLSHSGEEDDGRGSPIRRGEAPEEH